MGETVFFYPVIKVETLNLFIASPAPTPISSLPLTGSFSFLASATTLSSFCSVVHSSSSDVSKFAGTRADDETVEKLPRQVPRT